MTDQPYWPPEEPGAEALFQRGEKGDTGEKGDVGEGMTRNSKRAFAVLTVIMLIVSLAALFAGVRAYNTLRTRLITQCQFNHDLGNLAAVKVVVNPATHKASKVGIAIIADSRAAFRGLGCQGQLANPGPSFSHWAKVYGLPSD